MYLGKNKKAKALQVTCTSSHAKEFPPGNGGSVSGRGSGSLSLLCNRKEEGILSLFSHPILFT